MKYLIMIITPFLSQQGVLSYSIQSGASTALIDPSIDVVQSILKQHPVEEIQAIFLTHTHADFISSHAILKKIIPECKIYVHTQSMGHSFTDTIEDGQKVCIEDISIQALYTPGHTKDSITYEISADNNTVLFTGDTLLIGGTGRTDFQGGSSEKLYKSLQKILSYPQETIIYPNHNYQGQVKSTLGVETITNKRLNLVSNKMKDQFIDLMDNHKPPLPDLFNQSLSYNMK